MDIRHKGTSIAFYDLADITFTNPCLNVEFDVWEEDTIDDINYHVRAHALTEVLPSISTISSNNV